MHSPGLILGSPPGPTWGWGGDARAMVHGEGCRWLTEPESRERILRPGAVKLTGITELFFKTGLTLWVLTALIGFNCPDQPHVYIQNCYLKPRRRLCSSLALPPSWILCLQPVQTLELLLETPSPRSGTQRRVLYVCVQTGPCLKTSTAYYQYYLALKHLLPVSPV